MVATSGGWCGTKLDLFWFCTPKIHMFAFHLLNHNPSFYITYVLIITMANLVNYYLYLYIVTISPSGWIVTPPISYRGLMMSRPSLFTVTT